MNWMQLLSSAGLPAIEAEEVSIDGETRVEASFSRPLTDSESLKFTFLTNPRRRKEIINNVLRDSDWTELASSGLTLSEQIEQQEIRLAWMELDDPNLNPNIIIPSYPLMERL